jgi:Uma2 family endonuclease
MPVRHRALTGTARLSIAGRVRLGVNWRGRASALPFFLFMATGALISVEEYLATSYRPDREYIDGEVLERNLGEKDHSTVQTLLAYILMHRRAEWGIHVYVEQRVQVKPTRFRVPDLCVYAGAEPEGQIFTSPPLLCIEILSREDRWPGMQKRIDDYLSFGVQYVWVIDPRERTAYSVTRQGMDPVSELRTETPPIRISVAELFK